MRFATYKYVGVRQWARRHVFQADSMDEAIEAAILFIADGEVEVDAILEEVTLLYTGDVLATSDARVWQVVDEEYASPLRGNPFSLDFL